MRNAREFRNLAGRVFMIGVGAQKAGTTWLFDYLGRHPEVAMSPIKELHYFDQIHRHDLCGTWPKEFDRQTSEAINRLSGGKTGSITHLQYLIDRVRMNFDPAAYLEYFDRLATHGRGAVGEITPSYSLLPERGFTEMRNLIRQVNAIPRVVFIMRDPVERFWSQCRFQAGLEPDRHLFDGIFDRAMSDPNFLERTRYDWTIARLRSVFPEEELLFLFYEDLFNPASVDRLCGFLRIAIAPPDAGKRVHASVSAPLDAIRRRQLKAMFAPVYDFVGESFGDAVPALWRQAA